MFSQSWAKYLNIYTAATNYTSRYLASLRKVPYVKGVYGRDTRWGGFAPCSTVAGPVRVLRFKYIAPVLVLATQRLSSWHPREGRAWEKEFYYS